MTALHVRRDKAALSSGCEPHLPHAVIEQAMGQWSAGVGFAPVWWTPLKLILSCLMPRYRTAYPPEFRRQMVDLVRSGRTPEELAREFEPTAHSIST
jgi:hypothetical protein